MEGGCFHPFYKVVTKHGTREVVYVDHEEIFFVLEDVEAERGQAVALAEFGGKRVYFESFFGSEIRFSLSENLAFVFPRVEQHREKGLYGVIFQQMLKFKDKCRKPTIAIDFVHGLGFDEALLDP